MNIEIHIKKLVVNGIDPGDSNVFRITVERELARLLVERGVPDKLTESGRVPSLDGGSMNYLVDDSNNIGIQVAQAVYGGLRR